MSKLHMPYWPKRVPVSITIPQTSIVHNLQVTASRYPDQTAIYYYGQSLTYRQLMEKVEALSGALQNEFNVKKGDRVILFMQNSPQFVLAYYSILLIGAVVVPLNPMNKKSELAFYIEDSEATIAIVGQELYDEIAPLVKETILKNIIVTNYHIENEQFDRSFELPKELQIPKHELKEEFAVGLDAILANNLQVIPAEVSGSDIAILPYTSGNNR